MERELKVGPLSSNKLQQKNFSMSFRTAEENKNWAKWTRDMHTFSLAFNDFETME